MAKTKPVLEKHQIRTSKMTWLRFLKKCKRLNVSHHVIAGKLFRKWERGETDE